MKSNSRTFLDVMDIWARWALPGLESQESGAQKGKPGKQHPSFLDPILLRSIPVCLGSNQPDTAHPGLLDQSEGSPVLCFTF